MTSQENNNETYGLCYVSVFPEVNTLLNISSVSKSIHEQILFLVNTDTFWSLLFLSHKDFTGHTFLLFNSKNIW
jgi:hypothetical protein